MKILRQQEKEEETPYIPHAILAALILGVILVGYLVIVPLGMAWLQRTNREREERNDETLGK